MRLLPTTSRGTWLLAAAVWLAGSAAAWSVLPARPRAVVPGRDAGVPLNFTDDGRACFGQDYGTVHDRNGFLLRSRAAPDAPQPDGPFRLWDVATGRRIGEWPSGKGGVTTLAVARTPDGYAAVVRPTGIPGARAALLDLATGRRDELPWPDIEWGDQVRLTPDGRFLVGLTGADGGRRAEWWDRRERRVVRSHACSLPPVLTPDGGTAVFVEPSDDPARAHVLARDLDADRVLWRFTPPGGVDGLSLSPDGASLAVSLDAGAVIVDARRGRARARVPRWGPLTWSPDSRHLMVHEVGETANWVSLWDASTGRCVRRRDLSEIGAPVFDPTPAGGLVCCGDRFGGPTSAVERRLSGLPVIGPWFGTTRLRLLVFDAVGDREVGRLVAGDLQRYHLAPGGRTVLVVGMDGRLEFWAVPPRTPLPWLAAAAGVWAVPVAWLARRRVRRLRAVPV
jgi:hypothetical protein